jgi:hypothetical protein
MDSILKEVKDKIGEIIEISNKCPDKYQVKCFEILLNTVIGEYIGSDQFTATTASNVSQKRPISEGSFFSQYDITQDEWEKVYHYDGTTYSIIAKNLKVKGKANKQKRIALLLGVKNLLETDEAFIQRESLIQLCKQYDAFDLSNFATHMRKSSDLFIQKADGWILTKPGKELAAQIIKEISQ